MQYVFESLTKAGPWKIDSWRVCSWDIVIYKCLSSIPSETGSLHEVLTGWDVNWNRMRMPGPLKGLRAVTSEWWYFSREKRLGPRELVNICYFSMHCPARHRLCSFTGMTKEQVSDLVTEESCRFVPTAAEFNSITLAVSAGVVARSRICAWQPSVCIEQVRESMVKLCHVIRWS